jgi:DNA-binding MarR family transcriptional regulator
LNDKLLEHQKAFLLLQLLGAENRKLSRGAANKALKGPLSKGLALDPTAANKIRDSLATDGYIDKSRNRGTDHYQLTDRGLALLLALEQYPSELLVSGRMVNELVTAVREQLATWQRPQALTDVLRALADTELRFGSLQRQVGELFEQTRATLSGSGHRPAQAVPPVPPQDLATAIVAEFEELLRESHSHRGRVPIHELRRRVRDKFGSEAAQHDRFDAILKQLRQRRCVRLVSISDLRDATQEELNESIPGMNETFFYVEPMHEQPALS